MRKYRLIVGKYYWDRKKKHRICLNGNFIQENNIQSLLFLRQDGKVGDMVVHTMIFKAIKTKYPRIKIAVITRGAAQNIIEKNPYVDKIYEYKKKEIKDLAKKIAKEYYDILVDFSFMLRVRDMQLISLCKAKYNFGVNRENWNLFDVNIPFSFQEHISSLYLAFLKKLGIEEVETGYELFFENKQENRREYIVFNPYAASNNRSFHENMILKISEKLLKHTDLDLYIIGEETRRGELKKVSEKLGKRVHTFVSRSISEIFPLIHHAAFVITPDTAIVHIAVALQKEMIAIYRKDRKGDFNSILWGPNFKKAYVLYSSENDVNDWERENWECLENRIKQILK